MAPGDDLQPGRRRGAPDPSLALQTTEDSRPLGTDDEAKDQEELQVQVDQGALPRHLLLQVRLGEQQQDGQQHPQESPLNSSDQLLRLGGDIYVVVRQNLPNHRSNINCNMTNVCPLCTPLGCVCLYLLGGLPLQIKS